MSLSPSRALLEALARRRWSSSIAWQYVAAAGHRRTRRPRTHPQSVQKRHAGWFNTTASGRRSQTLFQRVSTTAAGAATRPVADPDGLAAVGFLDESGSLDMINISRPFYKVFRKEQQTFSDLIGFAITPLEMKSDNGSTGVKGELVSGSYFQMLG